MSLRVYCPEMVRPPILFTVLAIPDRTKLQKHGRLFESTKQDTRGETLRNRLATVSAHYPRSEQTSADLSICRSIDRSITSATWNEIRYSALRRTKKAEKPQPSVREARCISLPTREVVARSESVQIRVKVGARVA